MSRKGRGNRRIAATAHRKCRALPAVPIRARRFPGLQPKTGLSSSPLGRCAVRPSGAALLAVALVFGQTVRHEFINYDDQDYVHDNPSVCPRLHCPGNRWPLRTSIPATGIRSLGSPHAGLPLYGVNHPGGHHLTNVLLHAASAILLFLVLRRMTGDLWPAVRGGPVRRPSVARRIGGLGAERKDVLSDFSSC